MGYHFQILKLYSINSQFIPILGGIPGIKNGGKGGGIMKGENIPVGVAAAAGIGVAPLVVDSSDVVAPNQRLAADVV